jgi:hypothetical protein
VPRHFDEEDDEDDECWGPSSATAAHVPGAGQVGVEEELADAVLPAGSK